MKKALLCLLSVLLLCGCTNAETQRKEPNGGSAAQQTQKDSDWILGEGTGPAAAEAPLEEDPQALAASIQLSLLQNQLAGNAEYLRKILEMLSVSVTDVVKSGDTLTATVQVTAPDMYAIAKAIENVVFESSEEADEAVCRAMSTAAQRSVTVTVVFQKGAGRWIPVMTEELIDACYGGLLTYQQEYQGVD